MPHLPTPTISRFVALGVAVLASLPLIARTASAEATLIVEADSGKVLHAEHATYPWYPASTTKLMTMYLTLKAVKERRLAMDSLVTVTSNAVAQAPSKMGFQAGTQLTVDNALKMMMVKSANDIAVVLAEAVGGSIEGFADQMNAASRRLGMTQSSWVNPNGLPADEQYTSARDMAILARAILKELPEYETYWHIPAIKFGRRVMRNTNGLIGRYPDADGMKTGFICASGFNVVASATRGGRRLIVVVFGSSSGTVRSEKAAQLFEKGFNSSGLSWLMPSLGTVDSLQPIAAAPPNLRDEMCGKNRRRPASESADEEEIAGNSDVDASSALNLFRDRTPRGPLLGPMQAFVPVPVFIGSKAPTEVAEKPERKPTVTAAVKPTVPKPTTTANAGAGIDLRRPKSAALKPAAAKPGASTTPVIAVEEKKKPKLKKTAAAPAKPDAASAKPDQKK